LRAAVGGVVLLFALPASAQLRIVTYNTTGAPRSGMDSILKAIGEEFRSPATPIDILLLQEQTRAVGLPDAQAFVDLLNSIYAGQGVTYARGNIIGLGDKTQSIVYKTNTIELLEEIALGVISPSSQARQTIRHKVKLAGYDDTASFYLYNSHYKSSQGTDSGATTSNANRRLAEATAIRNSADALGNDAHVIYAGDHNFYDFDSSEPAFGALTAAGNGQAFDPVNRIGAWHNNLAFKDVHTQSPTTTSRYGGQVIGGLDDRFDFQLVTGEFLDSEGLSYIPGTYRAFGNNGTTYDTDIDSGLNTYPFTSVTFDPQHTRTDLLTALASVTDHLPVIADYQIPAKMSVQVAAIPPTATLGASIPITVSIENVAPASVLDFGDELDYTLSVSGDLLGGITSIDPPGGGGHDHDIFLNTATPGFKSGVITVVSTSSQAASPLFTMPVSFTVLGPTFLEADFDEDGLVDADDLLSWNANFGVQASAEKSQGDADFDGDVDGADFLVWQRQVGTVPTLAAASSVPEPAAIIIALVAVGLLSRARI
jgi:hypothetical protein